MIIVIHNSELSSKGQEASLHEIGESVPKGTFPNYIDPKIHWILFVRTTIIILRENEWILIRGLGYGGAFSTEDSLLLKILGGKE